MDTKRILFVCLGNICRSPAAEEVMRTIVREEGIMGIELDSAGLYGGHVGQRSDSRMIDHAHRRGYRLTHRARQVSEHDFADFDLIVAMDDSNFHALRRLAPTLDDEHKVVRMIDYVTPGKRFSGRAYDCVPDPYYEGAEGFELVLDLLEDTCRNLAHNL